MHYFFSCCLLLLLSITTSAICQKNLSEAILIKEDNDTISGYIKYKDFAKNPRQISYMENRFGKPIDYTPLEIKQFRVEDHLYIGSIVKVECSPTKISSLSKSQSFEYRTDTTFIQLLVDGEKSLYSYRDWTGKDHFFIKSGDSLETLVTKKYRTGVTGRYSGEKKQYVGQLKLYFQNYPEMWSKIEKSDYSANSLIKLFQMYHELQNENPAYLINPEKVDVEIGLLTGASFTKLNTGGTIFPYVAEADYPISANFTGGLSFDLVIPRNKGKWSLNTEVLYNTFKTSYTYEDYKNEDYYTIATTELGFNYVKLNAMVRYRFLLNNTNQIFINSGVSNGFVISNINNQKEYKKFYTTETLTEDEPALDYTQNFQLGYLVGVGYRYRKFSVEGRYEHGGKITNYFKLSTGTDRVFVLLSYLF